MTTRSQNNQLIRQPGKSLVAEKLCSRGFIATISKGNKSIVEIDTTGSREPIKIKVKSIKGSRPWQFSDVRKYIQIKIENNIQTILGKIALLNPNSLCIFVNIITNGSNEFYIFTETDLQEKIYKHYSDYLKRHNGIRPKNPYTYQGVVPQKELRNFRDNWELLSTIACR
jgi:hypothetical protein